MVASRARCARISIKEKYSNIVLGLLGGLASAFLTGCTPSVQGAPPRLFDLTYETNAARSLSGPEWSEAYARAFGPRRRELRDQIVLARMYAIDINYSEYEANLTRERQNVNFMTTVAQLALMGSATAVAAKETKTILAAVATGLTGVKEAYDKDILIEKTIAILQQTMRARRKEVKVLIVERLGSDTGQYPLELALADVEMYFRAGTITGAFIDVAQDVGVRLANARDDEARVVITTGFNPVSDLGARINAFAMANKSNLSAVTAYLDLNHGGMSRARFVRNGSRAEQMTMINKLRIP
jgi:hypothetical protein